MATEYPDTKLKDDEEDDSFGGAPANVFDTDARTFIDSVTRFLGLAYLTYNRVAYGTVVAVVKTAVEVGDVALQDPTQVVSSNGYYVMSAAGALSGPKMILGVFLDDADVGEKARIAVSCIVPAAVTGLAAGAVDGTNGRPLSIDPTSGKLRDRVSSEQIVGYADRQGNATMLPTQKRA